MRDLDVALEAARAGARLVAEHFGRVTDARFKGEGNPVTVVDQLAEEAILAVLRRAFPGDTILAEESGGGEWERGRAWIVDPLDGTLNFIHAVPQVAVSVALWEDGRPMLGVVVDPLRSEEFTAVAGEGARAAGRKVSVSPQTELAESLVATGFPYDRNLHAGAYAANLGEVLAVVQDVRRLGSAALDLAWVACGRYEGYWEFNTAPWDTAAGVLLVTEAGGMVTNHRLSPYQLDDPGIVASNGPIHHALAKAVNRYLPEHIL